jgi:hypothetical protein
MAVMSSPQIRHFNFKNWSFLFFFFLLGSITILAQNPRPTPPDDDEKPISIATDLVTLTLTVTDPMVVTFRGSAKMHFPSSIITRNKTSLFSATRMLRSRSGFYLTFPVR